MNTSFIRRIEKLETMNTPMQITIIIRRGVWPGAVGEPNPIRAVGLYGDKWTLEREPGEVAEVFHERACSFAQSRRPAGGVARLLIESEKPSAE